MPILAPSSSRAPREWAGKPAPVTVTVSPGAAGLGVVVSDGCAPRTARSGSNRPGMSASITSVASHSRGPRGLGTAPVRTGSDNGRGGTRRNGDSDLKRNSGASWQQRSTRPTTVAAPLADATGPLVPGGAGIRHRTKVPFSPPSVVRAGGKRTRRRPDARFGPASQMGRAGTFGRACGNPSYGPM